MIALLPLALASPAATVITNVTDVFYGGISIPTLGYLPCIRAPALVATDTTLVAFAECRTFAGDHCYPENASYTPTSGMSQICYRRSVNGGASWSEMQVSCERPAAAS